MPQLGPAEKPTTTGRPMAATMLDPTDIHGMSQLAPPSRCPNDADLDLKLCGDLIHRSLVIPSRWVRMRPAIAAGSYGYA